MKAILKAILKYITALFLFVSITILNAQVASIKPPIAIGTEVVHTDRNGISYDWQLSNKACFGCGSLKYCIIRTPKPDAKGLYYFYVYFWSNSYYANKAKADTYVSDIKIYAVDNKGIKTLLVGPYYIVALQKTDTFDGKNLAATLWSTDKDQIINVTWGGVTAY